MDDGPGRILVVEDEVALGELIRDLLRSEGYEAESVHDGAAALRSIEQNPPEAIVLDVMLPDMSGFDICEKLKLRRDTNLIPILMLTALSDPASVKSGLRVGANRYMVKPFDPQLLLEEVRRALDHARELRQRRTHTAIEIQLQSDYRPRRQLNDMLSELFVSTPLSDDEIHNIRFAVLEMIENAAEWGNRRRKDLLVTIRYELTDKLLRFVITDQGPGFDPKRLPHAATDGDPLTHMEIREKLGLRNGGFGILIARGMVDEFAYNETGNQVTLTKHFKPCC